MIWWPMSLQASAGGAGNTRSPGEQGQEAAVHDLLITNVQIESLDQTYTGAIAIAVSPCCRPQAVLLRLDGTDIYAPKSGKATMSLTCSLPAKDGSNSTSYGLCTSYDAQASPLTSIGFMRCSAIPIECD